jgi:hypothetical protein
MPQAIIHLGEKEDRVLTIVKGKYGLKNKSEAVNLLIDKYGEELLEPKLRPLDEKMSTALATEKVLAKDWNNKEDEEAWRDL